MTLSKTSKIILGVLALVIVAVVLWFLFAYKKQTVEPKTSETKVATTTEKNIQNEFSEKVKNIQPSVTPENVPVTVVAKRFASRLGTFSLNKKDTNSLFDLLPLVTPKAKALAEEYYAKLEQKPQPFYGISSKTVSMKVISSEAEQAIVELALIQSEQDSAGIQVASYQSNLKLELLKVNNTWLVDNFIWQ